MSALPSGEIGSSARRCASCGEDTRLWASLTGDRTGPVNAREDGWCGRTRTCGVRLMRPALYRLSYAPLGAPLCQHGATLLCSVVGRLCARVCPRTALRPLSWRSGAVGERPAGSRSRPTGRSVRLAAGSAAAGRGRGAATTTAGDARDAGADAAEDVTHGSPPFSGQLPEVREADAEPARRRRLDCTRNGWKGSRARRRIGDHLPSLGRRHGHFRRRSARSTLRPSRYLSPSSSSPHASRKASLASRVLKQTANQNSESVASRNRLASAFARSR